MHYRVLTEQEMYSVPLTGIMPPQLKKRLTLFAKDKRGVTAIEFAFIATPFFFLIFGILEICLLFIMSSVLEHGINEAARDIRTGQAQNQNFNQAQFKTSICDELFDLLDCGENLSFDVSTFSSFASTSSTSPIDADGNFDPSGFGYDPGKASDIVVVRVFYQWSLITPILSAPLANMKGSGGAMNKRLLQSTVAFRNEPYES